MKETRRIDIISCPYCGAQYTAGEIFIPKYFLGVPKDIEREEVSKKIIQDFGTPMNTFEKYTCIYCNTPFTVKAWIKFNVEEDVEQNINREHVTSLKKNSLFLKED